MQNADRSQPDDTHSLTMAVQFTAQLSPDTFGAVDHV
jgi:hypothetical protein